MNDRCKQIADAIERGEYGPERQAEAIQAVASGLERDAGREMLTEVFGAGRVAGRIENVIEKDATDV